MHKLVQLSIRKWLKSKKTRHNYVDCFVAVINLITKAFSNSAQQNKSLRRLLLLYIDRVYTFNLSDELPRQARLQQIDILYRYAKVLIDMGRHKTTVKVCDKIIKGGQELLSDNDPILLKVSTLKASALGELNQFDAAFHLHQATLHKYQDTFGAADLQTITCAHTLSKTLIKAGDFKKAILVE